MDGDSVAALEQLATVLGAALHQRDAYTRQHGDRVMQVSVDVGRRIGLSPRELGWLYAAAGLHDIGKIGIPDEILLNPGELDNEQRAVMRSHAARGENILLAIPGDDAVLVAAAVRHHHEEFDGTGYPDNLAGEDIPVLSRIISIVDNYDAMTSRRVYHGPRTHEDIVGLMHEQSGQKHDPYLLGQFMDAIEHSPLRVA